MSSLYDEIQELVALYPVSRSAVLPALRLADSDEIEVGEWIVVLGNPFGDEVTAVAMIDRLVHHAEILSLKGDSYRLRDKDLGAPNRAKSAEFA